MSWLLLRLVVSMHGLNMKLSEVMFNSVQEVNALRSKTQPLRFGFYMCMIEANVSSCTNAVPHRKVSFARICVQVLRSEQFHYSKRNVQKPTDQQIHYTERTRIITENRQWIHSEISKK